jgi:predicted MFS family arabinose efflux permease
MRLLDVAMQSGMVANQARVYSLRPDARSRLKAAYMTCAYLGGSAGSWLGVRAWRQAGWRGVCALIAFLTAIALVRHLLALYRCWRRRRIPAGELPGLRPGHGSDHRDNVGR